ncbi:MAG: ornithine carbamoyltransferase [Phycisphaerales bacterium]
MHTHESPRPLSTKDLASAADLTAADLALLLATAQHIKRDPGAFRHALDTLSIVLLFEKPSLRTRLTFEVGAHRLGGQAIYYDHAAERIGQRESIKDYAKNLERWVHGIVCRTYSHETIEQLARHSRVPVINALSDAHHPCQALADVLTLIERFGSLAGLPIAYIGDGNNVCTSLMHVACRLGAKMTIITPKGYAPDAAQVSIAHAFAKDSGGSLRLSTSPADVGGSRAIYTDTWVSMHQKDDADARERAFEPYRVDAPLMARAAADCAFMHCLPAHRGEEVTDEVIDSPASLVYEQAENRLHAQNALLIHTVAARAAL